ncbi:MAG: Eco57I restriction-modification methylase domain-containing protein, partial [Candidatus Thorarchaeota archaeon]
WVFNELVPIEEIEQYNLREGNSLIGQVYQSDVISERDDDSVNHLKSFHWHQAFPDVFRDKRGFDVIIGNPPYGNLLSQVEKDAFLDSFDADMMRGREGTWNAASLFIIRAYQLLNEFGELGFLVPNSILRVGQFQKTRRFLLEPFNLWSIADEGNPFDDVTLEMVTIYCSVGNTTSSCVEVISRRKDLEASHSVSKDNFTSSRIFSIYHDNLFSQIQGIGTRGVLNAVRGRDIPKTNIRDAPTRKFNVPYATKGRSINRYRIEERYLKYSDDWFQRDSAMSESNNSEFLVATKNFPYPRCVIKPKGMIHGGGIVRIIPLRHDDNIRAIGLVLNSQLSRYVCTRYLTNYSQLTTCLNTGIINEFPVAYPEEPEVYAKLFDLLQLAHSGPGSILEIATLDSIADALVYSLYLQPNHGLDSIIDTLRKSNGDSITKSISSLSHEDVQSEVHDMLNHQIVRRISASPRMN